MFSTVSALRKQVDNVVSSEYIEYIWKKQHEWNTKNASDWLNENKDNLKKMEAEWKEERKEKLLIVDKYSLVPSTSKNTNPTPYSSLDETKNTRYLNNSVITTKGERYVVLKDDKPEWDGGSRGKVKSKGKRGVGYK